MKQTPRIVILGAQGAGKGTQAGLLKHRLHIPHISTGDILRDVVAKKTAQGKKIASFINAGRMIPDTMTNGFMRDRLRQPDCRRGWIVDGYPRSIEQAVPFHRFGKPNIVVELHFRDKDAIRRLSGRRVCADGHIYHIRHSKPKQRGHCDHDGLPLRQRDDDTPTAIRKRLKIFHARTEPVIAWYRQQGLVVEVDAAKTITSVYREMISKLNRFSWLSSRLTKK